MHYNSKCATLKPGRFTSIKDMYDPNSLTGRGIGSPDAHFYRNLFNSYVEKYKNENRFQINKFRTYAFSSPVYSAPLLTDTGEILGLKAEKKTRMLCQDLHKLYAEYKSGHLFFTPPIEWMDFEGFDELIEKQGVTVIPLDASNQEANQIRMSPLFYLNFITKLKNYTK